MTKLVPSRSALRALTVLGLALSTAHAQRASGTPSPPLAPGIPTVWVVDLAGGPGSQFTEIQPAVDAAGEGDVILVRAGNYGGPVDIDGKSLHLVAMRGEAVEIYGGWSLTVTNLAAHQDILVQGIECGALLQDNLGLVRFEGCELRNDGSFEAVVVRDCERVGFVRSSFHGGGSRSSYGTLAVFDSSVFLYDSDLSTRPPFRPGGGTAAVHAVDSVLYVAGTTATGGNGVYNSSTGTTGRGGPALDLVRSDATVLDSTLTGGLLGCAPGVWYCPPDVALRLDPQSTLTSLPGRAHRFSILGPVAEGDVATLVFEGEPGEFVFWAFSSRPDPLYAARLSGFLYLGSSWQAEFVGVLPASGHLEHRVPVSLPLHLSTRVFSSQGMFAHPSGTGPDFTGSPSDLVVLDRSLF